MVEDSARILLLHTDFAGRLQEQCGLLCAPNVNLLFSLLPGKEDALAGFAKYHPAFDEANGNGWLPLHKAAVQLNKNILEITMNGKLLFTPMDASEE